MTVSFCAGEDTRPAARMGTWEFAPLHASLSSAFHKSHRENCGRLAEKIFGLGSKL
jgi:hypothetical protein